MKDMELETLENPNNSKFEATFIAAGQLPSGCETMQMKLQEHRMASLPISLQQEVQRIRERAPAGQARKL